MGNKGEIYLSYNNRVGNKTIMNNKYYRPELYEGKLPTSKRFTVYNSLVSLLVIALPIVFYSLLSTISGVISSLMLTTLITITTVFFMSLINSLVLIGTDNDDNLIRGNIHTIFFIPKQIYKLYRFNNKSRYHKNNTEYLRMILPRGNSIYGLFSAVNTKGDKIFVDDSYLSRVLGDELDKLNEEVILYGTHDTLGYITRYYNILVSDEYKIYTTTDYRYVNRLDNDNKEQLKLMCDVPKLNKDTLKDWYNKQEQAHKTFKKIEEEKKMIKTVETQSEQTNEVLEFIRNNKEDYDKLEQEVSGNFTDKYVQDKLEQKRKELEGKQREYVNNIKEIQSKHK